MYDQAAATSTRLTLQHTTTRYTTLQHPETHCNTLQHTATHCNIYQVKGDYAYCKQAATTSTQLTLQHTATHCNALHHTTPRCNTLQHTATHCNTYQVKEGDSMYGLARRFFTTIEELLAVNSDLAYRSVHRYVHTY